MEELLKALGLDEDAPIAKAIEVVNSFNQTIEDKQNIIEGLQAQITNYEDQISSISAGVAEARVKDLVNKVQNETGYYVGKEHMGVLNRKAQQHLYAGEEEQKNIWADMKAHTMAYGAKIGLSARLDSLSGSREKGETKEDRRYNKAKTLIDTKKAENWEEAMKMVLAQEEEEKSKKED